MLKPEYERLFRGLCGFIADDIPELHTVEIPRIWESFAKYLDINEKIESGEYFKDCDEHRGVK